MNEKLREVKCFLVDMDGTIYLSGKPFDGAVEAIERMRAQGRVLFLTNNTSLGASDYVAKLNGIGFGVSGSEVYTAGLATISYLKREHKGKRVFLLGTDKLREEFVNGGIELSDDDAELAVVGYDTSLQYDRLNKFCALVRRGIAYVATHPDINCPTSDGYAPDVGSFIKLIEASTNISPIAICGKPFAPMADSIAKEVKLQPHQIAMIGDRLSTDMKFAVDNGFVSVLVLSGEATEADLKASGLNVDTVLCNITHWDK